MLVHMSLYFFNIDFVNLWLVNIKMKMHMIAT